MSKHSLLGETPSRGEKIKETVVLSILNVALPSVDVYSDLGLGLGHDDASTVLAELPDLLVRLGDDGQEEGGLLDRSAPQLLPTVRRLQDYLADLD